MGNVIQTNVSSLNAQRNLFRTNIALNDTFQRLSSGFRINSAKDDAAGLQISNQLTTQINGLTVGIRNANDGLSVAQVAEGAQQEITNILQRMVELAMSAANGTTEDSGTEKVALNSEFQQLISEVQRIADTTAFGGTKLLSDTPAFGTKSLQVGPNTGETIDITVLDVNTLEILTGARDTITTAALAVGVIADIGIDNYQVLLI